MTGQDQDKPPRHDGYSVEERSRRILWRTVSFCIFAVLGGFAFWLSARLGWPFYIVLLVIGLPYWAVVTAVWRRKGPYMPGLHEDSRPE